MRLKLDVINCSLFALAMALTVAGCNRASRKEAPVTGKSSDPAVAMPARWQEGKRHIFRVETVNSTQVPRKNTTRLIHSETSVGQDLAFSVTNAAPDGSRVLQMEILAVQMETGRDDSITMSFDSANQVMQVEDNPLTQRLRRFVGLKLFFRLSPENKVTRIDNVRDLNDRQSGGGNIRGAAASVISRCFTQQFYREIVEMDMLPKTPVKIGDRWTVDRPANAGPGGSQFTSTYTCTFAGWQEHMGTNCARLEFTGEFKPAPPPPPKGSGTNTNNITIKPAPRPPSGKSLEDSEITGHSWYSPEHTLAIETIYHQSITAKSTVGRVRPATVSRTAGTNAADVVDIEIDTNAPPPNPPGATNGPPPVATTVTTTTHQSTSIKLIEIELLQP